MTAATRVWSATAAYALLYSALGCIRYVTYHAGSDLGLFTQSIATVLTGFSNTTEGGSHFTYHFSPLLYVCAPALIATHSPLALVALQAIAGALVAPPLYLIARKRIPEPLAAGVAFVALLYPPLAGVTFADFHENGFAPAATLWLLWAVDAGRLRLAAILTLVALAIKEDQAVLLAFAGLAGAVAYARAGDARRARFCGATAVFAVATLVTFFTLVRPAAGATAPWAPTHFYAWGPLDARGQTPWYSVGRPAYVLEAFVPLAFAAFATPAIVLALPGFAEVLASHESITYTMGQHYAGIWIGYVLFAFALGIGRLYARSPQLGTRAVRAALVLCALVLAFASPTHWGHYLRARSAHDAARDRVLARLVPDLEVGVSDALYAHLGFDRRAMLGLERAPRFALIDVKDRSSYVDATWAPVVAAGARTGAYRLLWSDDGLGLYERRGGTVGAGAKSVSDGRGAGTVGTGARDRRAVARGGRHE